MRRPGRASAESDLTARSEMHHHHHDEGMDDHHHHHHDHNLRSAYLHVLADALTSVLAIFALLTAKHLGWVWMDPVMGIVARLAGLTKNASLTLATRQLSRSPGSYHTPLIILILEDHSRIFPSLRHFQGHWQNFLFATR